MTMHNAASAVPAAHMFLQSVTGYSSAYYSIYHSVLSVGVFYSCVCGFKDNFRVCTQDIMTSGPTVVHLLHDDFNSNTKLGDK